MSFGPAAIPRAFRALRSNVCVQPLWSYCIAPTPSGSTSSTPAPARAVFRRSFHASPASRASARDPYAVLGLSKDASASDIKKAYYVAAKRYHPDSSKEVNAREKFQEIQAAYEILSDPEKKQQFDQFGEAGFDPSGGFHPGAAGAGFQGAAGFGGFGGGFGAEFSFEDIFSAFGGGMGRKAKRRGPFAQEILVGGDIDVQATISFMEAASGTKQKIHTQPHVLCTTCDGSGLKPGTKKRDCGRCGGSGTRVSFISGGFQMAVTCETCGGTGSATPPGGECETCNGDGITRVSRVVDVDIPAGVEDGMRMRVEGEGDAPLANTAESGTRKRRGDMIVHIRVAPHEKFSREGANILYTAAIPLTTALLGGVVKVPTLQGDVELPIRGGVSTGDKVTMPGKGMRVLTGRRGANGDLLVEFKVNMPKTLTTSQRILLELLADEFRDNTAKRSMNAGKYTDHDKPQREESTSPGNAHDHDGFLKRIWEKLTHHGSYKSPGGGSSSGGDTNGEDERKASGSG